MGLLLPRAHSHDLTPLSPHYRRDPRPGLLLGFGAMDEDRLREGVRVLAPFVHSAAARGGGAVVTGP